MSIPKKVRAAVEDRAGGRCEAVDCDRLRKSNAGGARVCLMHYKRWKRHGDINVRGRKYSPPNPIKRQCSAVPCDRKEDGASGLCKLHGTRQRRHGDPEGYVAPGDRAVRRGKDNASWGGDDITYGGAHGRVRRVRGRASTYDCVDCGGRASQWSYSHDAPDERRSALGTYSPTPDHYEPRCVPCHKRFDLGVIRRASS